MVDKISSITRERVGDRFGTADVALLDAIREGLKVLIK